MIFTKTVEEKDYKLISEEVNDLKETLDWCITHDIRIDIGHPHRFWEYGMCLASIKEWEATRKDILQDIKILEVGAGLGLLTPTVLKTKPFINYTEVEPNIGIVKERSKFASKEFTWFGGTLSDFITTRYKNEAYDVVTSISVIEHVAADHEFLRSLTEMVNPGGLLFITTDVMPLMPGNYHFDNLREHNYTTRNIEGMVDYLKTIGFVLFGESDFEYKGDQVFNYSFASLCMVKK